MQVITVALHDLQVMMDRLADKVIAAIEKKPDESNNKTQKAAHLPEKYLSKPKLAEALDTSPRTLTRLQKKGLIVPIQVGGMSKFKLSEVVSALEKHQKNSRKYSSP